MSKTNAALSRFYAKARRWAHAAAAADRRANDELKVLLADMLAEWEDVPVKARPDESTMRIELRALMAPYYGLGLNDKGTEFARPSDTNYDKASDKDYDARKAAARQRLQFVIGKMGFESAAAAADSVEVDAAMLKAARALIRACNGDKKAIAAALAQAAK